jgi:hypothetical protein
MKPITAGLLFVLGAPALLLAATSNPPAKIDGRWQPTMESLAAHRAPEWLLDAKLGVQYVGEPRGMDEVQCYHWTRAAQRARQLGAVASDAVLRDNFESLNESWGVKQVFLVDAPKDLNGLMQLYRRTGARFLVSMLWGAYPGTEGLRMTAEEAVAARRAGFHVGLHYNLIRRDGLPSCGDPGYVDWWQTHVQAEVEKIQSEFVFFDGPKVSSTYLKTQRFVAWYYNWADQARKQVWVNDDWGSDCVEKPDVSDVLEGEGFTYSGVAPKPFINWDILCNDWTCWVNEFGRHKHSGEKWEWIFRKPEHLLQVFLYNVSVGGVWLVQLTNSQPAWDTMFEIGDWLAVNGEAIYGTRPLGPPDPAAYRVPDRDRWGRPSNYANRYKTYPAKEDYKRIAQELAAGAEDGMSRFGTNWDWRFAQALKFARSKGPVYFTRKGGTVYAIHWGAPTGEAVIPGITPKPGSAVRMLGVDRDLAWQQRGRDVVVQVPAKLPCKHAVSFALQPAR